MKPSQIVQALGIAVNAKRPTMLWGPPGVGKSDLIRQLADTRKLELRDVRLSLLDPVDLKGFPTPSKDKKQMTWLAPDFLPTSGEGILFLDEINSAPQAVQAAAYQLTLDRRIGNYELPHGWSIIAAGNRMSDRSVVNAMPAALASRLIHLEFDVDVDEWCQWAMNHDVDPMLVAFIRFRPALLHSFDPSKDARTFPAPRTWKFVDDIREQKPPEAIETSMIKGCVGEGAALEFMGFIRTVAECPSTEQILIDPKGTQLPTSPASLYALTTNLARCAKPGSMDQLMDYIERMSKEFQVVFVKDALQQSAAIANTKRFLDWGIKNQADLMS